MSAWNNKQNLSKIKNTPPSLGKVKQFADNNKKKLPPSDSFEDRKRKNTICFEPDFNPRDLRVQFGNGAWKKFPYKIQENDVLIVPGLFWNIFKDFSKSYDELMNEMNYDEFCPWHGHSNLDGTHWIMNDRAKCKERSLLFHKIVDIIANYFDMDVHATRFNLYEKGDEWKPYHFDAAAIDPEKAKNQNITIGVSFGAQRSISFQHAKTGTTTEFVLPNGMFIVFSL